MMREGGKSKLTCPADLAYGSRGSGRVPGGAALTFEVELIEVVN
jgi:FKBP-type peptidyl-prolyl cis-trans isomerase FkpA